MALRGSSSRCVPNVSLSALPRISANHSLRDSRSHPDSSSALLAASVRSRKRRRLFSWLYMCVLFIGDPVAARYHRTQVVPEAADDDLEHMDENEPHQQPRHDKVNRARRLPAAKHIDPAW